MKIIYTISFLMWFIYGCKPHNDVALVFSSSSMEPAIQQGEKVVLDLHDGKNFKRFEIVAFKTKIESESLFSFRIVGMPGKKIEIRKSMVLINNVPLEFPDPIKYTYQKIDHTYEAKFETVELGFNEYFLLGDNLRNARDSRFIGPVAAEAIVGRIVQPRN